MVLHLLREGRALGQRLAVLCLEKPGSLAPRAEALGVQVLCADKRPGLRLEARRRVRDLLRQFQPDVVHTHQIGALFYTGPAARSAGVPLTVHTEHGKHYAGRRRTRWLGWLAARSAAGFFCVSEDIAREVIACRVAPRRKVRVVANGIDTARFRDRSGVPSLRSALGVPPDAVVVGTVGRLAEVKRQDLLLRAFAAVRREVSQARLLVVGDGPLRADLEALAASLGLGETVYFAGYQPEPAAYLAAMEVFALTSRSEGMPLVVLEAWAAGVPVVASAVGGVPELIRDGDNGLLFRSGDEGALTTALAGLLRDPARRSRLAHAGRDEATTRFDVRSMAAEYEQQYRILLGDARCPLRYGS
jgi:glycosyltransferase involved in cell wall biosynthesis